ncbi:uncharacterized protein cubi_01952 [Cryptosporidium ubiquitum]|uniref:Uncharacterized protein n=1 Tax=Cryptosporidium ubiquitum TaxID=857276 RepID=A0A1J4MN10_9CRYT|nr:uncharacterized protein cubi_01952 [Cryptosporidium ubiquitum]OII75431.1 hypothetical protein cubi_01952 [Cryptosporidium ubiquitum]
MPIEKKEVFKAIFKSKERKPIKEEKTKHIDRNKFVKNNVRYIAPNNEKVKKKVENMERDLKRDKRRTKLMRFFDNKAISRSSPLDSRLGTYYEFENGLKMSIITTEGTEVSSITLNLEISAEDIKQEKIPGLYHLMIQLLFSEKFLKIEYDWNPLELSSFREYVKDIGGKINIQYIPSCIMISVGCPSKHYIKMLEHLFDAIYLKNKGKPRKLILRKSSIEQAIKNMNLNYLEYIQDESYLRFEILREYIKSNSKVFQRTTNYKTIDLLKMWSIGSESTVLSLIKEGNLEAEIMQAYNRIINNRAVIVALHSNLSNEKLFKILNDYNIPILQENELAKVSNNKFIGDKIFFKQSKSKNKNNQNNSQYNQSELPPVTVADLKPSIIVNSPIHNSMNSHGEIEIQWIIPAFYSSLSSSNSKPLKVISYLLESGSLVKFLNKRKLIKSISSGEVYFAAHSSQKLGFTIYSVIIKLSEKLESDIDPKSPLIQFIVQSIFTYFNSLIEQIEESLIKLDIKSSKKDIMEKKEINKPFLAICDIIQIENYISNSNYQMNSERDNYIDFFDRNFEITETAVQNLKSHNPSEILVGNNRFYSKVKVILKYVKFTLENALKPSNFIIFISSESFFKNDNNGYRYNKLKLSFPDSPNINYFELKFEPIFLNLLKEPETLKKYVIKLDPLKQIVFKNHIEDEYKFPISPHPLLKNSELTFLDGGFEWNSFSNQIEDDNPIKGTTPYISEPTIISQDENNRFLMYYSQINYPDKSNEIIQSSLSSAIIRWYENIDYSQILRGKGKKGNLAKNSILASFISRIIFTIWVTTTLSLNFTSYRKIGATINFQPCHHFGTALSTNCVQLQVTSPSPMFPEYLKEVLKSIRTVSMLNISQELSEKLKVDAIKEIKQNILMNSATNSCTDKIKQLFLPEIFSYKEVLSELKMLESDEIMILLDKKLDIKNPLISVIGLITHIDEPNVSIDIIKESLISNVCFNDFNYLSNMLYSKNVPKKMKYPHPLLEEINSSKTRLLFYTETKNREDQNGNNENFEMLISTLWISVSKNDIQNKSMLILLVRVIQFTFKNIYLPTSLLVDKAQRKNINLLVIPSPFLNKLGLQLIIEVMNNKVFSSSDITTSMLLLDFLSFIESSKFTEPDDNPDYNPKDKSNLLHHSLNLNFKQIKTEVILQLLLSQTQIVAQSSYLFSRIVEFLGSETLSFSKPTSSSKITNEKERINGIIRNTSLTSAISFLKSIVSNNSMILVESNSQNNNSNNPLNEIILKYGFELAN